MLSWHILIGSSLLGMSLYLAKFSGIFEEREDRIMSFILLILAVINIVCGVIVAF